MGARFGPSGTPNSFGEQGYKKTIQVPEYVQKMGLNHFEYQCGRGVRIKQEAAEAFGQAAKEHGITLSLHAPYYISLSSVESEKKDKSIDYILESAKAASAMGADRIVVHSGSCGKISREKALSLASDTLKRAQQVLDEQGLSHIHICPETMGKINQLGTLDEVLQLCLIDDRMIPCIDFGHLNARTLGSIATIEDYDNILQQIYQKLGEDRYRHFHAHFSKIQYTDGGEKCHLTFEDMQYGPEPEPLMELVARYDLSPVFCCESAGTQAEDAYTMLAYYEQWMIKK